MKQNLDFTEIKQFCDKVGLNCQIIDEGVIITKPKDIWDGVEFFEGVDGIIRPMNDDFRSWTKIDTCNISSKPSTESAYIEQLKKEAFQRFGEINSGDSFIKPNGNKESISNLLNSPKFLYFKDSDTLYFGGVEVYQQGKWATRVKERVKVVFFEDSLDEHNKIEEWGYVFKIHNYRYGCEKSIESGQFLSSQLEKYLNGEIE